MNPFWSSHNGETQLTIYQGDVLETMRQMPDESVHCVVTSPPYWGLRDYGTGGQIGLEKTPDEYVAKMVEVFREVRRVLRKDGTVWLNMGDSYASIGRSGRDESPGVGAKQKLQPIARTLKWKAGGGHNFAWSIPSFGTQIKPKDLIGIPWRVAFALQFDGWWLRSDVVWSKPNPMPESVTDRPTKAHEYVFLLAKAATYYYDADAIKEPQAEATAGRYAYGFGSPKKKTAIVETGKWHTGRDGRDNLQGDMVLGAGRNRRTVWTIPTEPYPEAHFATYPQKLVEPCIMAGCRPLGVVLDPFLGSGTTLLVAQRLGRNGVGIELSEDYCRLAVRRIEAEHSQVRLCVT